MSAAWWLAVRCCRTGFCNGELGVSKEAKQQHFKPQPWLHALTQLLFAALELCLPVQQSLTAQAFRKCGQLLSKLWGYSGELWSVRCDSHQHQVAQNACQPLQHGSRIPATIQQASARLEQRERLSLRKRFSEVEKLLLGNGSQQVPDRVRLDRSWEEAELIEQAFCVA